MKKMNLKFCLVLVALSLISAPSAHAFEISLDGGAGFFTTNPTGASTVSPYLGGELTFGATPLQIGVFYDNNFLNYAIGNQTLRFYGGIARLGIPGGFFVDAKAGATSTGGSDTVFGFGGGIGYKVAITPLASIGPRVGYRYVPYQILGVSTSQGLVDVSLLVSVGF